ncbi:unnamed protein product [Timema podura]|uniref:Uncharacterized protein n=1 Tax=Timema podura TaxID=61482 RepID=A0ABN7NGW9_TIMPD|nr:unnamed protein product [Timema podura]
MANGPLSPGDPHSFSRPDDVAVNHMHLSLEVDFERNTLSGFVDLTVDRKLKKATTLHRVLLPIWAIRLSTKYANVLRIGKFEFKEVNPHLRGGRVENNLGPLLLRSPDRDLKPRISPSLAFKLNTKTSASANYVTKAGFFSN